MNDPARAALRCARPTSISLGGLAIAAAAAAAAACARDPSLAVSVHHPAGFTVAQTWVTVYVGDDISCEQIQLGDRTPEALAAISVDAVDVTDGGQIEVERLGGKSIVARGYDAQHRFITAGCKDVGEIAGATQVTIATVPTATVAIDPGLPDRPFAERSVIVNMTDPNGKVLDGELSWELTGPAGAPAQTATAGMATRNGNIKIDVADLGTPGPQGLRIRAPWATAPLPIVTGFDLSHSMTLPLGNGTAPSHPSCAVRGHAGRSPTLICLTQAIPSGHRDLIEIGFQGGKFTPTTIPIAGIDNQFAVVVDRDGSADEPVYVLSDNAGGTGNWYRLGGPTTNPVFGAPLQNVIYVPKCKDNATTALVGVQTGTALGVANQVKFYTPSGAPVAAPPFDGEILAGGCVDDVDKKEHQCVVVSVTGNDAALAVIVPGTGSATPITAARFTGTGFITVESQGMIEKRFAGTRLQASGTVVFESVLAPQGGNAFMLLERTELETAAPPQKIISGKLDRDPNTDLMWDIAIGARRRMFQVSLALEVGGAPLTAITSGPGPVTAANVAVTDFVAADLNGKLADEMILFTQSAVTIYSADE
jgi:hypothetical protein